MKRREFLAGALAPAWLRAGTGFATRGGDGTRYAGPIIDTHTHFYDPARPQGVPWPGKNEKVLYRTVLPPEFERLVKPLGVTGTVIVEASPWVEDNRWVLDLIERDPFLLGLVGHIEPGAPEFAKHLDRFRRNPCFLGLRIGGDTARKAHTDAAVAKDLERLADSGLALDLLGDVDAETVRFAQRFPRLRIVIDHLPGEHPPGAIVRELGACTNVFAKVSGVLRKENGEVPTEVAVYRAVLDELWDAFGSHRLVYGSNWPVSNLVAPYPAVLRVVTKYFGARGQEAAGLFFAKNSQAAYRWKARG